MSLLPAAADPPLPATPGAVPPARVELGHLCAAPDSFGRGLSLGFLWWLMAWWHRPLAVTSVPGSCPRWSARGAGTRPGFFPAAVSEPGGMHAAGVQGSLSSCNIPHMKYEAKFLPMLQEEPGVNCLLPAAELCSSSACTSWAAPGNFSGPAPLLSALLKGCSSACNGHGLLGLGGQGKGSSGQGWATCGGFHHPGHGPQVVLALRLLPAGWGRCCAGSAGPSQVPVCVLWPGSAGSSGPVWWDPVLGCRTWQVEE